MSVQTDFQSIRNLVSGATLAAPVQRTILTRFDALPQLYADLDRTYESRFADRIADLVQGMVRTLSATDAGAGGAELAVTLVTRMRAMHDRHGVAVALKPPPVVKIKTIRKKKPSATAAK